ncbi:DUF3891 family protein [Alkalihalobacterium alkalinitrilicum]
MIVRERTSEFIMYEQHHHAFLSGEMAKHFQSELGEVRNEEVHSCL